MINELTTIIEDIVKYGLQPNLEEENKIISLEKSLVSLYALALNMTATFDKRDYPVFDRSLPELRKTIESNFPSFGYYKVVIDINDFQNWDDIGTGDAIDDLHDIIKDLLEVKWRMQHNSSADGIWYFKFTFSVHIKYHLLGLLSYMSERE